MLRTLLVSCAGFALAEGCSFAGLTVKAHTEGSTVGEVKAGVRLFYSYGDDKTTIQVMPKELEGLPAIKAADPYKVQQFELSEPARAFWVFYPRVYTPIPEDWRVFRQRSFSTPFDYPNTLSDVYYKDFPAGKFEVNNSPNRLINVGFKALSEMTLRDCALNLHSPTETGTFQPGKPILISASVDNPSAKEVAAQVRWRIADQPREQRVDVVAPARQEVVKTLSLPGLAEGLHLMDAELWINDGKTDTRRFPIAVLDTPKPDATIAEPFFPVGAYNKLFLTHNREISRIYLHAICHSLRKHNLNTLVGPALDDLKAELDIAHTYGLRLIVRVDEEIPKIVFKHPAVLAYMFGDEPKPEELDRYKARYDAFREEHPEHPLVTCMVGEVTGSAEPRDPVNLWKALGSPIRMLRFYPFRKASFDLINWATEKMKLQPKEAFRLIEESDKAPWWYVIQTFGGRPTSERPDPYWRNPSPEELTALAHLGLANGSRAFIGWPLQTHGPEPSGGIALITQETLADEDGKYAAYAKVAATIAKFKELLLRHERGRFEAQTNQPEVLAVPRVDPVTRRNYLYLVNMDAKSRRAVRVTLSLAGLKKVRDLYSGKRVTLRSEGASRVCTGELGPGEGQLWELVE